IGCTFLPLSHFVIGVALVLLAASKASLVALYFMHLAHEKPTLTYIALTPAILCVFLVLMLLPDLGAITRLITTAIEHTAEATGHGRRPLRPRPPARGRRRPRLSPRRAAPGPRRDPALQPDRAQRRPRHRAAARGSRLGGRLRLHQVPRHLPGPVDAHVGAPGATRQRRRSSAARVAERGSGARRPCGPQHIRLPLPRGSQLDVPDREPRRGGRGPAQRVQGGVRG